MIKRSINLIHDEIFYLKTIIQRRLVLSLLPPCISFPRSLPTGNMSAAADKNRFALTCNAHYQRAVLAHKCGHTRASHCKKFLALRPSPLVAMYKTYLGKLFFIIKNKNILLRVNNPPILSPFSILGRLQVHGRPCVLVLANLPYRQRERIFHLKTNICQLQ